MSHSSSLYDENKKIVLKWLDDNNIHCDKVIFSPEDKLKICLENDIDVMIEDKVENINEISKYIPVICFNAGYNEKCIGINIYRAYSWYDVYAKIDVIKKGLNNVEINEENINLAIKVQNQIFPNENAAYNYYEFVKKIPYRKELIYWLVFDKNKVVGISGLYSYLEYPDDAWLGWYGVLEKERSKGYGKQILKDFEKVAKAKGYKNIRLYTDEEENKDAICLYKKFGMIGEIYDVENEKLTEDFISQTLIFSKSLTNEESQLWDNKYLGISENLEKEKIQINNIDDINY